jgi:spermidine/putrescine transport system substrate-binding protein
MSKMLRLVAAVLLLAVVTACGAAATPAAEAPAAPADTAAAPSGGPAIDPAVDKTKLAPELHFLNWTDYIDPQIVADFEATYGVKVIVDNFDANEDMIAKIRAGGSGYDLVTPSDYAVQTMATEGLLAPLDKALLSNSSHIDPTLMDKYFDKGNVYSIPYMYGITGIAYNKKTFPTPPDSWATLFDTAGIDAYKGQFSMLDDEREVPGAALKYLGYSLNETSPEAIAKVQELLIAQKPYLASYNSSDVNRKLASEEYLFAHAWSGMAMQARNGLGDEFSGNENIGFFIPKEGGMIWMDNMVVLKESPNAYTAQVFMNYLLDPTVAAANTTYIGYLTPNKDAIPLLEPAISALYAEGFSPSPEVMERLEWAVRNESTVVFTDVWTAVKGE